MQGRDRHSSSGTGLPLKITNDSPTNAPLLPSEQDDLAERTVIVDVVQYAVMVTLDELPYKLHWCRPFGADDNSEVDVEPHGSRQPLGATVDNVLAQGLRPRD